MYDNEDDAPKRQRRAAINARERIRYVQTYENMPAGSSRAINVSQDVPIAPMTDSTLTRSSRTGPSTNVSLLPNVPSIRELAPQRLNESNAMDVTNAAALPSRQSEARSLPIARRRVNNDQRLLLENAINNVVRLSRTRLGSQNQRRRRNADMALVVANAQNNSVRPSRTRSGTGMPNNVIASRRRRNVDLQLIQDNSANPMLRPRDARRRSRR